MDERERYERGLQVRREVLGEDHVARSLAAADSFTEEYQDLITRHAWGEIWTRPALSRRERSLMVLATMVALGCEDELRLHVRAAFNNGLTQDDIKEALLQAAVYAGVPKANAAFRIAREVLAERG